MSTTEHLEKIKSKCQGRLPDVACSAWVCMICQRPIPDYVPDYCCAGLSNDCYCLGYPINSPVCSYACDKAMMDGIGKPMDERRIAAGIELFNDSATGQNDQSAGTAGESELQ